MIYGIAENPWPTGKYVKYTPATWGLSSFALGFKLFCGKSVKYRYIEFLAFDDDSLPYLLSLFSGQGLFFL